MEPDWNGRYRILRSAYQSAFHEMAAEAGVLRDLAARSVNGEKLETARRRVEEATAAYRTRRNSLTDFLLQVRR